MNNQQWKTAAAQPSATGYREYRGPSKWATDTENENRDISFYKGHRMEVEARGAYWRWSVARDGLVLDSGRTASTQENAKYLCECAVDFPVTEQHDADQRDADCDALYRQHNP